MKLISCSCMLPSQDLYFMTLLWYNVSSSRFPNSQMI